MQLQLPDAKFHYHVIAAFYAALLANIVVYLPMAI